MRYRDDRGDEDGMFACFAILILTAILAFSMITYVGHADGAYGQDTILCKQVAHDAHVLAQLHKPWGISCNPQDTGWTHNLTYERLSP